MSKTLKQKLKTLLKELPQNSERSIKIGALHRSKKAFSFCYGKDFKHYDLASMTKAMFTAPYVIENFNIEDKVSKHLPWLYFADHKISDLLNHSSGLPAHKKYFHLFEKSNVEEAKLLLQKDLQRELKKAKRKKNFVYSDLGFLLLGLLMEAHAEKPLHQVFKDQSQTKFYLKKAHFNVQNKLKYEKRFYAPTEVCPRRGKMQGQVLDGNTYFFEGVGAQAGLFGGMQTMFEFGHFLKDFSAANKKAFAKRNEGWASGFMTPTGALSSAGSFFSKKSIGHLGFTGTSFWYDPSVDLYIFILANRTYPNREDVSFNAFRSKIQDMIYKECVG